MEIEVPQMDPEFARKREQWTRCLDHKDPNTGRADPNTIEQQMYGLVWDAGVYRVINEARRLAERDAAGQVKLSGVVHGFINRCFFRSQLVGIRKVIGSDADPLDGKRGVFALRPLIKDMMNCRHLFTRANLFAARGLSMDAEGVRHALDEFLHEQAAAGDAGSFIPERLDFGGVQDVHREIDELCLASPASRNEDDTVAEAVFTGLIARLSATQSLADHVNKLLAHAATPDSRSLVNPGFEQVTLGQLWQAHEIICRTVQFIDVHLLRGIGHGFLASYAGDLLRYVEQPLATTQQLQQLQLAWDKYDKETQAWQHTGLDWVLGSLASP